MSSSHPIRPSLRDRLDAWRIDRPAAVGLALLGALAVLVVLVLAQRAQPHAVGRVAAPAASAAASADASSSPSPSPSMLVVAVAGRVRDPGLVRVPPGSRVHDVVQAAGGFKRAADAVTVNLARPVADGEQVIVGDVPGAGSGVTDSGGGVDGPVVSLNSATADELEALPGVGPVLAQRIVEHRRSLGGAFTSIDQLRDVSGIGAATFAEISPHVRL